MLAPDARHKLMANKLKIEVDAGRIDDDYATEFIDKIHARLKTTGGITTKQEAYLEQLFERY